MSRPKNHQGRLPESMGLSLGLHALLLLIPLGALIHSEGEVEGRTRVQLIELDRDRLGTRGFENLQSDALAQPQPSLEATKSPPSPLSAEQAENDRRLVANEEADDVSIPKDPSPPTAPFPQDDPREDSLEEIRREQPVEDLSQNSSEPPPLSLVEESQKDETAAEAMESDSRNPLESTDSPPATLVTLAEEPEPDRESDPEPEPEPEPEEEEKDEPDPPEEPREFARAPSRGPESPTPPNTSRISDQNMRVEEESRAAVHSTEEGSAELGVTGSTASSGRPAPPGSQPAGRRGQSGEDEEEELELKPADTSSTASASGELNPQPQSSEGIGASTQADASNSSGSLGSPAATGSNGGRSTSFSPGQDGYSVPQAPDGDIAALLAARRGNQGSEGVAARSRAGAPYRPSLAMPGSSGRDEATGVRSPENDRDSAEAMMATGDGLAEAGDRDGLHPEAAEYRRGAPSGGGSIASPGAADRSATAPLTVADLSVRLGDVTRLNARATPLGVYISTIEDKIRKAWVLPVEYRAMGTQGVVEVSFVVSRNGRVSQAQIVRKSGTEGLDRLALQSIPRWLPRFPDDIDRRQIQFSYVFRATDSIVTETTRPE